MWIHQEETKRISYIDQLEIQISDGGYDEVGPEWCGTRECSPFSRHKAAMKRWNLPRGTWR